MKEAYKYIIAIISIVVVLYFISMGESLEISKSEEEETTTYSSELEEYEELEAAYEFAPDKDKYSSYQDYKVSIKAYSIDGIDEWEEWKNQKDESIELIDYGQGDLQKVKSNGGSSTYSDDDYIDLDSEDTTAINLFTGEIITKEEETTTKKDSQTTTKKGTSNTTNKSSTTTKKSSETTKKAETTTTKSNETTTKVTTTKAATTTTTTTLPQGYGQETLDGVKYYTCYATVDTVINATNSKCFKATFENDGYETYIQCINSDTNEEIINIKTVSKGDRVKLYYKEVKTSGKAWRTHPDKITIVS